MSWLFSSKTALRSGPEYVMHLKKKITTLSIFGAFTPVKCLSSGVLADSKTEFTTQKTLKSPEVVFRKD